MAEAQSEETFRSRLKAVRPLAADGCLLTAGTFSLMMVPSFLIDAIGGLDRLGTGNAGLLTSMLFALSSFFGLVGFALGPAVTWWLHGKRIGFDATVGAIAGFFVAGAAVISLTLVGMLAGMLTRPFVSLEFAGPVAVLVAIAAVFVIVVVTIDIDALRDLRAGRAHTRLDIARLIATVAVLGFAAFVARTDVEAGSFLLAAGVEGAVVVTVAEIVTSHLGRR